MTGKAVVLLNINMYLIKIRIRKWVPVHTNYTLNMLNKSFNTGSECCTYFMAWIHNPSVLGKEMWYTQSGSFFHLTFYLYALSLWLQCRQTVYRVNNAKPRCFHEQAQHTWSHWQSFSSFHVGPMTVWFNITYKVGQTAGMIPEFQNSSA